MCPGSSLITRELPRRKERQCVNVSLCTCFSPLTFASVKIEHEAVVVVVVCDLILVGMREQLVGRLHRRALVLLITLVPFLVALASAAGCVSGRQSRALAPSPLP